jgi:predicted tellurium resistance membrane protein TerC
LLFGIVWVTSLVEPWFTVPGNEISGRDIILIVGGIFLPGKFMHEMHSSLEITHAKGGAAEHFSVILIDTILSAGIM